MEYVPHFKKSYYCGVIVEENVIQYVVDGFGGLSL